MGVLIFLQKFESCTHITFILDSYQIQLCMILSVIFNLDAYLKDISDESKSFLKSNILSLYILKLFYCNRLSHTNSIIYSQHLSIFTATVILSTSWITFQSQPVRKCLSEIMLLTWLLNSVFCIWR